MATVRAETESLRTSVGFKVVHYVSWWTPGSKSVQLGGETDFLFTRPAPLFPICNVSCFFLFVTTCPQRQPRRIYVVLVWRLVPWRHLWTVVFQGSFCRIPVAELVWNMLIESLVHHFFAQQIELDLLNDITNVIASPWAWRVIVGLEIVI